jgi:hypothetical protein
MILERFLTICFVGKRRLLSLLCRAVCDESVFFDKRQPGMANPNGWLEIRQGNANTQAR